MNSELFLLRPKQVNLLYNQQPSILLSNIVAGTSLFIILLFMGSRSTLYSWYSTLIIFTAFRWYILYQYNKNKLVHKKNHTYWLKWLLLGSFISGVIWGLSWIPLEPGEVILQEGIVVLWITGMCSGATSALSIIKGLYFIFTLPAVLLMILYLLYVGGSAEIVLAYALIMYYVFTTLIALRNHKDLNSGLVLQIDNERLLKDLNIEQSNLQKKNLELLKQRQREVELQEELLRRERLATIGQLAGMVSHELRNPLGTIRTTFSIIKLKIKDNISIIQQEIERIERNIERCNRIIEDILDYAKESPLRFEFFQFDPWLNKMLNEINVPSDITFTRELDSDINIYSDQNKLHRAIINIIENSIQAIEYEQKHSHDFKKHYISITTGITNNFLEIRIQDNGPGIKPNDTQKIFEPLFSTKMFGVGLGLPIVKQIINEHEGTIHINSREQEGTEFIIMLPIMKVHHK